MKIIGITQARLGSSRLPNKVLKKVQDKTLLEYHLHRAKQSKLVDKWIVATTDEEGSDLICLIAKELNVSSFKGSLEDVLDRFYQSVKDENPDYIVRITSDCPLIDAELIDKVIKTCIDNKLIYYSNTIEEGYPDGLDVEIFSMNALSEAWEMATIKSDREHVTPYIKRHYASFVNSENIESKYSNLRITVDEFSDFILIEHLITHLGPNHPWLVYADYLLENNEIVKINNSILRNNGFMKSKFNDIKLRNIINFSNSIDYKSKIHDLIPGGCHTYSKGDDQFPLLAPSAILKGKGAYVWDIDENQYLDCSMGLTSVSLGHANDEVVKAVSKELENGVNFQRPSYLEKLMAETFLDLIPIHDMIKFSKNGSIVTTAAVKLARAKTGRKLVAFPHDHPFYSYDDWFIGTTKCNKGVPEEISNLSVTFQSFNLTSLRELFEKYPNQIACVITEPEKPNYTHLNDPNFDVGEFLKEAIDLCHRNGALFIADEMVTGFKTDFPGSTTKLGINPDMATWGKGIANGFSFCALTGKKEIMSLGGISNEGEEKVFLISTTHGGETHGLSAAIATIDIFKKNNVIKHNHYLASKLSKLCSQLIEDNQLTEFIEVVISEWMPIFIFKDSSKNISLEYKSLFMQEMIKRGVLFQGIFVPCYSHTEDDIYYFAKAFSEAIEVYQIGLNEGYEKFLIGPAIKPVFRKYN